MKLNNRSFTLLEVILAVTLFSIVMVTVASGFYYGSQAWQRGLMQSNENYKAFFVLEKITKLLREGIYFIDEDNFYYQWFFFEGDKDKLSFASLVELDGDTVGGFVKNEIFEDDGDLILLSKSVEDIVQEKDGSSSVLLAGIEHIDFSFAALNLNAETQSLDIEWFDEYSKENFPDTRPEIIRIRIFYQDEDEELISLEKDVFLQI